MNTILSGLKVALCIMDDVLVFGQDGQEYDVKVKTVLQCLASVGIMLNPSKYEFSRSSLKFLGYVVNKKGISADPEKVRAVTEMPVPTNGGELQDMINQLGIFFT